MENAASLGVSKCGYYDDDNVFCSRGQLRVFMAGLNIEDVLFYAFGAGTVLSAVLVVFFANPIYSALFLALAMSMLGALFFVLEAYFISVAQITVYAGAVMVLFVMVLMLFDLKNEGEDILKVSPLGLIKLLAVGLLCGFFIGTGWAASKIPGKVISETSMASDQQTAINKDVQPVDIGSTVSLSRQLFSKYVFAFEAVSILLLVAIVGSVALARSKGGTHHVSR